MGLLKLYGISQTQNSTLAAQYFHQAALRDHKEALTAYAVMLLNGQG